MAKRPMLTEKGVKPESAKRYARPEGRLRYSTSPKPKRVRPKGRAQAKQKRQPATSRPVVPSNDPLAPLTGRGLRREVDALAQLQYGGQERELANQRAISQQAQANIPGWYQSYKDTLTGMQQAQQQAYQAGQQAAYSQANQMFAQQQGALQQQGQQAQADAAARGVTADASVQTQALQGASQNQAMGTAFGGLIGAQGASQNAIQGARVNAVAGQQLQAQNTELAQRRKIEQMAADLAADKGVFKVKARGDIRTSERTYDLNRKAFGLDVAEEQGDQEEAARKAKLELQKLRALNRDRKGRRRLTKRGQDVTARGQDLSRLTAQERLNLQRQQDLADDGIINGSSGPAAGQKSGSTLTPSQRRGYRSDYQEAVAALRVDPKWSPKRAAQFVNALTANGTPKEIARAAVQAQMGGVDPKLARQIRKRYGFTVGNRRKAAKPTPKGGARTSAMDDTPRRA